MASSRDGVPEGKNPISDGLSGRGMI